MKSLLLCLLLGASLAHAQSPAELEAMMAKVRSVVTDIGTKDEVKAFDAQMDETRRLKNESAATQADTARIRTANAEAQRESDRQNARARFEQQSRDAQAKQDELNRNPRKSGEHLHQPARDKCPSCR